MKLGWTALMFSALATQVLGGTDSYDCKYGKDASVFTIADEIVYIDKLSGAPTARAGKCNRVSCSYGSGIYVCSDDGKDHKLKSWRSVGDAAVKLQEHCGSVGNNGVHGRLYSSDGWGVVIQEADC